MTPVLYAIHAGLFEKAGLDVSITNIRAGAEVVNALVSGDLELGQTDVVVMSIAHSRGIPIQAIASTTGYNVAIKTDGMFVAASSTLRTPKDLVGKTIGVPGIRGYYETILDNWLDVHGVAPSSVKLLEIPPPSLNAAVESGRIDAALLYDPLFTDAIAHGARAFAYPIDAMGTNLEIGCLSATVDWANAHKDTLGRFTRVLLQATEYISKHEAEGRPLLAQFSGVPLEVVQKTVPTTRALYLDPAAIQPFINAAAKYHLITKAFPAQDEISPYALQSSAR
jgi:NitT/TauT family transport system substrate-binding protein